jgi:hypothetical protein
MYLIFSHFKLYHILFWLLSLRKTGMSQKSRQPALILKNRSPGKPNFYMHSDVRTGKHSDFNRRSTGMRTRVRSRTAPVRVWSQEQVLSQWSYSWHIPTVTVNITSWYRARRLTHCDHFWYILRPHLSFNHSWFIHQSSLAVTSRHLVEKQEKLGEKLPWILLMKYLFSYLPGSCRKILRHGTHCFTPPPEKVLPRIFIALGSVWNRETWIQWQPR